MDFHKSVSIANLVPYTGAKKDVNLGGHNIQGGNLSGTNTGDQNLSGLVPYGGAISGVNLGSYEIAAANIPNKSCVYMYDSADQTIPTGTVPKKELDITVYDVLGEADLTNNRITVLASGYYLVIGSVLSANDLANNSLYMVFEVNGSALTPAVYSGNSGNIPAPHISQILHLNAGDYVELFVYQNSGADVSVAGGYGMFCLRRVL